MDEEEYRWVGTYLSCLFILISLYFSSILLLCFHLYLLKCIIVPIVPLCHWVDSAIKGGAGAVVSTQQSELANTYFRVLFNGRDVVPLIPACQTFYWNQKRRSNRGDSATTAAGGMGTNRDEVKSSIVPILCPLTVLEEVVDKLIRPYATIEEACSVW